MGRTSRADRSACCSRLPIPTRDSATRAALERVTAAKTLAAAARRRAARQRGMESPSLWQLLTEQEMRWSAEDRHDAAHAEYQTARDIVDRFAQQPSDEINWPLEQVFIHSKIGDTLQPRSKKPAWRASIMIIALPIAEKLVRTDPPHKKDPLKKEAVTTFGHVQPDRADHRRCRTI